MQDYSHWSDWELRNAETAAGQFLDENAGQIVENLRAKIRFLDFLVQRLDRRNVSLDQRLDCFARIAEVAQFMKEDAEGFFELAGDPIVARLLSETSGQAE